VILIFPIIVYIGASGKVTGKLSSKICTFLGDISYPIYIVHFPIAYVFYAWVSNNSVSVENGWMVGVASMLVAIGIAYLSLRFYDIPVRKWLTSKLKQTPKPKH